MIYKHVDETPVFGGSIRVDFKETQKAFVIKTLEFNYRYPAYGIEVLKRGLRINKSGSAHAIVKGETYFVLYPYRIGKPFLFEVEA